MLLNDHPDQFSLRYDPAPCEAGDTVLFFQGDQVLLLTKRPTKVAEIIHYQDARPRTVETWSQANFVATKKRTLEIFQREVRR